MELWAVYDIFIISTVGTPPPHKYEFVDTENVTDFDKDEKPKTVRSLVDYSENGAFSQSDMSAEVLSQTRAFSSHPDWTPRMFERDLAISVTYVLFEQKQPLKCMSEKCLNVSDHSTFLGSSSMFLLIIHVYLYKCNTKKRVKLICLNYTKLENINFDGNGRRCLQVSLEFFLNVSLNSVDSVTKIFVITVKKAQTCHSATSCVRDQDATTAPARHM